MSIEKLELVSIAGTLPQLNEAIVACLQSKVFHIENAGKLLGTGGDDSGGRGGAENPFAEPLRALLELNLREIAPDTSREVQTDFTPEEILAKAKQVSDGLAGVRDQLAETRRQITDYESASIHLKNLSRSDIDLGELTKCRHIVYRFGRMPEENMQKLDFYSDEGFIFQAYHTAHEYVWGFYFATQERILAVDAIMKGLLFERFELPDNISGTPEQALAEINIKLTEARARLEALEKQEKELLAKDAEQLGAMYCCAKYQSEVYRYEKHGWSISLNLPDCIHSRCSVRIFEE